MSWQDRNTAFDMRGIVFDIKEFAVNDGAGIRTTVFLKGCPLHCIWCHNPEGLKRERELYIKQKGCTHCRLCYRPCSHPECQGLGRCLHICLQNLVSVAGVEWESEALAERLLRDRALLQSSGGGVTLSGGEPLLQWEFCRELFGLLDGKLHRCIETSGYAKEDAFRAVMGACDFVIMDLKLADPQSHRRYTGVDNAPILQNAAYLQKSGIPHLFRVPLIPAITDTRDNLQAIARIAGKSRVELLPYNVMAGAKYASVGRSYPTNIDPAQKNTAIDLDWFYDAVLK